MSFNDYEYALKFRNVVKQICTAEIDKIRPRIQYATVNTIDRVNRKCTVIFPGDSMAVPVNMGAIQPASIGQVVRINGVMGDRFIEDVMGPIYVPSGPWVYPTLGNSWTNYNTSVFTGASYRRMNDGTVMLRGLIKTGTVGTPVFTLPVGYRPSGTTFSFACMASLGVARVYIYGTTGAVEVDGYVSGGTSAFVSLSDIRFATD